MRQVRQALCYAVDRDAINNFIFGGKSHIIGSHMIPAMSKYYEPEAETVYSYDPEKAKELLADAGYADGFDLEITVPSSYSQHVDSAQIIADASSDLHSQYPSTSSIVKFFSDVWLLFGVA